MRPSGSVIWLSEVHPRKARSPMLVRPSGREIEARE